MEDLEICSCLAAQICFCLPECMSFVDSNLIIVSLIEFYVYFVKFLSMHYPFH